MKWFICIILSLLLLCCSAAALSKRAAIEVAHLATNGRCLFNTVVILDAGHGGEDGGAIGADGTLEKDINLKTEKTLACLFHLFGVRFKETRNEDRSVGDQSLPTLRERKKSDILTRYQLVNDTESSLLLSIHQNQFQESIYSGTQVFYAGHIPSSRQLAEQIQSAVSTLIQPANHREIKASDSHIFLLYRAKKPSVMIECGFLSNPDELALLKTQRYQLSLSFAVCCGLLNFLNLTEGETPA